MVNFTHRSESNEKEQHIWPFCYFHGEAEDRNYEAFQNGGDAPDLSVADEPIDKYIKGDLVGSVAIPCTAYGEPAVVIVSRDRFRNGISGRIALIADIKGMKHVYSIEDWR